MSHLKTKIGSLTEPYHVFFRQSDLWSCDPVLFQATKSSSNPNSQEVSAKKTSHRNETPNRRWNSLNAKVPFSANVWKWSEALTEFPMMDPCDWYIYLHGWLEFMVNIGKYIYMQYMDPMGLAILKKARDGDGQQKVSGNDGVDMFIWLGMRSSERVTCCKMICSTLAAVPHCKASISGIHHHPVRLTRNMLTKIDKHNSPTQHLQYLLPKHVNGQVVSNMFNKRVAKPKKSMFPTQLDSYHHL